MNILEICQEVADIAAVQKPVDLFNVRSQHDSIFLSVAKDALQGLLRFGDWQELINDATLECFGSKKDYIITDNFPDFYCLSNNTVFIRDKEEKLIGVITPEDWQKSRNFSTDNGDIKFRIQNNMLRFSEAPNNGVKVIFQYRSSNIIIDPEDGYAEKSKLSKNSNEPIFDNYIVKLAILWRLLSRNGMNYAETKAEYERETSKRFGSAISSGDINLAGEDYFGVYPGGVIVSKTT